MEKYIITSFPSKCFLLGEQKCLTLAANVLIYWFYIRYALVLPRKMLPAQCELNNILDSINNLYSLMKLDYDVIKIKAQELQQNHYCRSKKINMKCKLSVGLVPTKNLKSFHTRGSITQGRAKISFSQGPPVLLDDEIFWPEFAKQELADQV